MLINFFEKLGKHDCELENVHFMAFKQVKMFNIYIIIILVTFCILFFYVS